MKVENIKQLLVSDLLGFAVFRLSGCCKSVTAETKALIRCLNSQVQDRTKMETTAWVLILMLEVVNRIPRVMMKMQPSVQGHSTSSWPFQDYCLALQVDSRLQCSIAAPGYGWNATVSGSDSDNELDPKSPRLQLDQQQKAIRKLSGAALYNSSHRRWNRGTRGAMSPPPLFRKLTSRKVTTHSLINHIINVHVRTVYTTPLASTCYEKLKTTVKRIEPCR